MMQLARAKFAEPAPDFTRLVPLDTAAQSLCKHRDHLRRLCRTMLVKQGLAFFLTPPDGGQAQWFITRAYDPRLQPAAASQLASTDLSEYTARQSDEAMQRAACVQRLRFIRVHGVGTMRSLVGVLVGRLRREYPGLKISATTLYRWDASYQTPADLWKLVDVRGGDRRHEGSPQAWNALADLFLHENRPTLRQCWKIVRRMATENGWQWCSYESCRRNLDKHISPQEQARHREPKIYRQTLAPFIAQDPESWEAGQLWIGDHCQLNLVCRWESGMIRPWLTTWIDWRTRKIVGWMLSDTPNSTSILAALRHGLMDESNFGGPAYVWIDNGKDYDAWLFHGQTKKQRRQRIRPNVDEPKTSGIFNALGIEAHFSTPYNPNGKARMERWFRKLEAFGKLFKTYTGDAPDSKPELHNEIIEKPMAVPAFEEVLNRVREFIAGCNADADHAMMDLSEDGATISPSEALLRWCNSRRVFADPHALDLLLAHWHKPVTVGRNGISLSICGRMLHYGQFEPQLAPFKAKCKADRRPVIVAYDPHDYRTIRVHDSRFVYICTAQMNQVGGMHTGPISAAHVAELNRNKANYDRSTRHVAQHQLTQQFSNEEQLAIIASSQPLKRRDAEPAMKIMRTPMDGQAREIEQANLRQAVGAESTALPTMRKRPSELLRHLKPRPREDTTGMDVREIMRKRNHSWV